jgi:hypothetical protein
LRGGPVPLREIRAELPAKLEAVIAKALAVDPGQRFGTMAEMAHAFESAGSPGVLGRLFRR